MVTFDDGIAGEDFYRRIAFSCQLRVSPARVERLRQAEGLEGQPVVEVTTVLPISGGVTSDWIAERILEWDAMLRARRPKVVRQRQRG